MIADKQQHLIINSQSFSKMYSYIGLESKAEVVLAVYLKRMIRKVVLILNKVILC